MTSRFPSLPALDREAALPAALALLLALGIGLQLLIGSDEAPVPQTVGIAGLARQPVPPVPPARVPPGLLTRALFLPAADAGTVQPGASAPSMSIGAVVAGSVARRGRRAAVLVLPDGGSRYLVPGQSFNGWQLLAISETGARFRRDGREMSLSFGAAAPPPVDDTAEQPEDQQ